MILFLPLIATERALTLHPNRAWRFCSSLYPEIAMQAAKKVTCHRKVKPTANTEYLQKICTERKGLMIPIQKEIKSVKDVMVMETAASDII